MSPILKDGTYFIINKKSNTAFDLSVQDQRAIIGYCRNGGANQKVRSTATPPSIMIVDLLIIPISSQWRVRKHHDCDGSWTIQSVYNSRYLDVDIPNVYSDGVRVVAIDTQQPRKWDIRYDDQFHGWR